MANPLLARTSALFGKIEAAKGTPAVPANTDCFGAMNVTMQEDTTLVVRNAEGGFGKLRGVPGATAGTCTFTIHLEPGVGGAVPLWASTLLPACAYVEGATGVFARTGDTSLQKTVTLIHYKGAGTSSIKQTLAGAMGTARLIYRNGQPHEIQFTFRGKLWEETTATLLAPTLLTSRPPRGYQTLTIGAAALLAPEVTYDLGSTTLLLEGANDANATGYLHAIITDFNPTLTTEPYQEPLAVRDWRADFFASTELALSIVVGVANPITLASAGLQLSGGPGFGNREQAYTRTLTFNDNAGATITFA